MSREAAQVKAVLPHRDVRVEYRAVGIDVDSTPDAEAPRTQLWEAREDADMLRDHEPPYDAVVIEVRTVWATNWRPLGVDGEQA